MGIGHMGIGTHRGHGTHGRGTHGHGTHGVLQVRAVQALPDGRLASASQDHTARLWTPKDGATDGGAGGVYYDIGGKCLSGGLFS